MFYGDLNDNGSTVTGKSVSDSMGLFIAVRTSSTNIDIYKGNVLIGSETQNVVGIPTFKCLHIIKKYKWNCCNLAQGRFFVHLLADL